MDYSWSHVADYPFFQPRIRTITEYQSTGNILKSRLVKRALDKDYHSSCLNMEALHVLNYFPVDTG